MEKDFTSECRQFIIPEGWTYIDELRSTHIPEGQWLQVLTNGGLIFNGDIDMLKSSLDGSSYSLTIAFRFLPKVQKRYALSTDKNSNGTYRILIHDKLHNTYNVLADMIRESASVVDMFKMYREQWKHAEDAR